MMIPAYSTLRPYAAAAGEWRTWKAVIVAGPWRSGVRSENSPKGVSNGRSAAVAPGYRASNVWLTRGCGRRADR